MEETVEQKCTEVEQMDFEEKCTTEYEEKCETVQEYQCDEEAIAPPTSYGAPQVQFLFILPRTDPIFLSNFSGGYLDLY